MRIGNASKDENRKYRNGKAGDQTGAEVYIRDWYDRPWTLICRALDINMAEKIACLMEQACANNNIGYDQNERNTLLKALKNNGYNMATVGPCETDCSALVATILIMCGMPEDQMVVNGNLRWTGNFEEVLRASGKFEFFDGYDFLKITDNLRRGDILLYAKGDDGHVAVALDTGKNVSYTAPAVDIPAATNLTVGQEVKLIPGAKWYDGSSIPSWVFGSKLYVREIGKNDRIVVSTQKTGAVTGAVNASSIQGYSAPAAQGYKVKVRVNSYLNVRTGPGTSYGTCGRLYNGNEVIIVSEKNGWGERSEGGWIALNYTYKV
jgi:hypothetical protein